MLLIEEKSKTRSLPVSSSFYRKDYIMHRHNDFNMKVEYKDKVSMISNEMKESNTSDFTRALLSIALATVLCNYIEQSITANIEYKINSQLNNLFR